ncbi:MAG TPA: hypothetical protein VL551_10545 [Actinospica sp.]|nr:hypothetical protein [Actinospica sp.]
MHALLPGQGWPACNLHLHGISPGDREVLAVHTTCYPYEIKDGYYCWDRTPPLYSSVVLPPPWEIIKARNESLPRENSIKAQREYEHDLRRAENADILTAHIVDDAPPVLALDALARRYPHAMAYAVIIDKRTCLAAIRLDSWRPDTSPHGYTVTMAAAEQETVTTAGFYSPPVILYAALLLGWARWWVLGARDLTDHAVGLENLPPPPLALDLVEAWQPHRVELRDPERVTWHRPDPPTAPDQPWGYGTD